MKKAIRTWASAILAGTLCAPFAAAQSARTSPDPLVARALAAFDEKEAAALVKEADAEPELRDLVQGIVYHNLGVAKPSANADKAIALLRAVKARSDSPLCSAYLGSAITLKAGLLNAAKDAAGASALLDQGFALMDGAVAADPQDIGLRFLRAENSIEVSQGSPFDRGPIAAQDLKALKEKWEGLGPENRSRWHLLSARLSLLGGDAKTGLAELDLAVKAASSSPTALQARKLMARYAE